MLMELFNLLEATMNKYDEILESFINGQRKQGIKQFFELSLSDKEHFIRNIATIEELKTLLLSTLEE